MKSLFAIAVGVALFGLATRVSADDTKKDEQKKDDVVTKLLGSWEVTKADDDALVGATITFEKEGKFIAKVGEMTHEGTYKIDENGKLITTIGDASDSDTIKKLTADVMELENKDGKATNLKKKK
jgi:uncharacterized protein (TIGR03066 family)